MITRLSIFNITLSFWLLNPIFAQDEDEQVGVNSSQDLYIAFDQTRAIQTILLLVLNTVFH